MSVKTNNFEAIAFGSEDTRIEALREFLGYPLQELDKTRSGFRYLRAGRDITEARQTCPIAVWFYEELDSLSDTEIKVFLTATTEERRIYDHYLKQGVHDMPLMYLLLPKGENVGRVALVLPTDSNSNLPINGKLRQRQIQTFAWDSDALKARLVRLQLETMLGANKISQSALSDFVPVVDWVFYEPIKTAKELAQRLAIATRRMEQEIPHAYDREGAEGYLNRLFESFKKELLPNLKLSADNEKDYSFADIYAQTIAYGLFTARVFLQVRDKKHNPTNPTYFRREDAWEYLPETNPFLKQLFRDVSQQSLAELGDELSDAIAEIFSILRAAQMDAILSDFEQKMNREDIVIRFYEDFLTAYKPQMRERRGVYYTPEPVVSYMVRSVDILIKEKFGKPLGLADPEVMILDPACGTGTFLLWIFKLIEERFKNDGEARSLIQQRLGDISWSDYVKDHLLPRVFGFELLMAPYAICHLKLGLFLEESGYLFGSSQRLGVYLTNTLDDAAKKSEILLQEYIAEESNEAAGIKRDMPVMVVVGNPPYSPSTFEGKWIMNLMKDYKKDLNEKKSDLNREEWKFFRFSQNRIDITKHGVVALITNHSYISGLVHREMRKSLFNTFDKIFIFDLQGNVRSKLLNAAKDKNIFDIQQGVSIFIGFKIQQPYESSSVSFSEMIGDQSMKLSSLLSTNINTTDWQNLEPERSNFFFFCPKKFELGLTNEYDSAFPISNIFLQYAPGVKTERDRLNIHESVSSLKNVIADFRSLDEDDIRNKYNLGKDSRDWQVLKAKKDVISISEDSIDNYIETILYRPFDFRYVFYSGKSKGMVGTPGYAIGRHMVSGDNIGIVAMRQIVGADYSHFGVTNKLVSHGTFYLGNKGQDYLFPLYLYPVSKSSNSQLSTEVEQRRPNLSEEFLTAITNKLGYTPTPEAIFYYIYAIFHSPTYRTRYAEFLKIDFPRVPLTSDDNLFRQLAQHGEALVALHLMKSPKLDQPITQFIENDGDSLVDAGHPKYADGNITINKKGDKFTGIPESVWNFYVGGYQVCHKWLKDRKGRQLSPADITHYQKIVIALSETMEIMKAIDAAIPIFPIK